MSHFDSLLKFCNNFRYIYCFGAGMMGAYTVEFLNKYGIGINGYIVSKRDKDSINGIKVYQIEEVVSRINKYTGIILSLDEKNHREVLENFERHGVGEQKKFFRMSYKDIVAKVKVDLAEGFGSFTIVQNNEVMNNFIDHICNIERKKLNTFQMSYEERYSKYNKIILAQYYMRHIGEMCLTYYLWCVENKGVQDVLYVMMPVLLDNDYNNIPNNYFFQKIQERMEIITCGNYEFWRWMLQYHGDKIDVSTKYNWIELKNRDMSYIPPQDINLFITLNSKEKSFLNSMNIGDEFVCIYSRDSEYYNYIGHGSNTDSYKYVTAARNSSIRDFELLASEYREKNLALVRMGYIVAEPVDNMEIIDYANFYRTEALDFYLISNCKFFVVSGSGIMLIAILFNTPIVYVNAPVISFGGDMVTPMSPDKDLVIMKKIWYQKQNRYLSLDEILYVESKYQSYEIFDVYARMGMVFEDNSPEELFDVAEEMRSRVDGNLKYSEEEELLQKRYRLILDKNVKKSGNHFYNGRYGTKFLKKNSWFLDDISEGLSIKNIL